jgi:hypothetical protein
VALNPKTCIACRDLALNAAFDALGAGALLRIYDGAQPTDSDTALGAQVKLAELPLSATPFAASASASKAANAITSASILATSTATWATLVTSGGVRKQDFSVGTSGANLNFNSVLFSLGATCTVSSLTETMAA